MKVAALATPTMAIPSAMTTYEWLEKIMDFIYEDKITPPACANEWQRPFCRKPLIICAVCERRELLPVTDQVKFDHPTGKHTVGTYPLLLDETCWFLAADFNKQIWQEDSTAFIKTCEDMGKLAALERSRSGNALMPFFL